MTELTLFELVFNTFIALFVVIDPIGLAAMFVALTHGGDTVYKRRMAVKGTLIAGAILVVFAAVGEVLLHSLGITLSAFRVAGGGLLFLLAVEMVFARHSGLRSTTPREQHEAEQKEDISVFPLAIPLIAGPGALTTVLLMFTNAGKEPVIVGAVFAVLFLVLAITLVALLTATRIMGAMGETGTNVVTRVLGVLLAALAVQFIFDGVQAVFSPGPAVGG